MATEMGRAEAYATLTQARRAFAATVAVLLLTAGVGLLERKNRKAVVALRDSEASNRAIMESAADGIITIDEHGIVRSFNLAVERMFGYTAEETIGKRVNMLMPSPYQEEHDAYMGRYLQTNEAKIIGMGREFEALRKDGTTFPIDLAVSEVRLDSQRLFTGIVRDITERKDMEQALRFIVQGTSTAVTGREFFRSLVRDLAGALRVRYASVAELVDGAIETAQIRARWADGDFAEDLRYRLAGTPCKYVVEQGIRYYPEGVQEQFPEDDWLCEMGVESYLGVRLNASSGETLGLLCVLHDKPFPDPSIAKSGPAHIKSLVPQGLASRTRCSSQPFRSSL